MFGIQPLVIIIGPTAVGKTAVGVELALAVDGEIISGDSVQVYRKLDIGSAKPSKEEQKGVQHHLLDFLDPAQPYTVALFQAQTEQLLKSIKDRGKTPKAYIVLELKPGVEGSLRDLCSTAESTFIKSYYSMKIIMDLINI